MLGLGIGWLLLNALYLPIIVVAVGAEGLRSSR